MVTFLTLFLGLTTGIRPVEVAVGPGVAAVELRLDGRAVATLAQPPWRTPVDLGLEPEPHELLAIGRNAAGVEVVRARQMVNMSRPPAEAVLLLLPGSGGRTRRARLTWQSALGMPPERIAVTFDGQPVPLEPSREIALPDYVPEQVHFLRAELDFPDNLVASAEIIFGGHDVDEARAELTGIPVALHRAAADGRRPGRRFPRRRQAGAASPPSRRVPARSSSSATRKRARRSRAEDAPRLRSQAPARPEAPLLLARHAARRRGLARATTSSCARAT